MNTFLESPTAKTLYDTHWAQGIVRVAEKYHDISGEGKTPLKIPHTIPNGEKEYKLFDCELSIAHNIISGRSPQDQTNSGQAASSPGRYGLCTSDQSLASTQASTKRS